jgi:glycosyltransferase involved in cell wall biosynthesis
MQIIHRILHTWEKKVDIYITFTKFFKEKFIEWGLPKEKIVIKPHFVYPDPGYTFYKKNYTLFIGRLDPEKGIETLLNAWRKINIPLLILGKGRLADIVQMHSNVNPAIYWLPHRLSRNEVLELIKNARFLIWPSLGWYENFGMVAIESFSCGTPVIASKTGAMAEIVEDGRTGLLFEPGNPEDMAARVAWAWAHPEEMRRMGKAARQEFEEKYTAEKNYQMLMQIYERARAQR